MKKSDVKVGERYAVGCKGWERSPLTMAGVVEITGQVAPFGLWPCKVVTVFEGYAETAEYGKGGVYDRIRMLTHRLREAEKDGVVRSADLVPFELYQQAVERQRARLEQQERARRERERPWERSQDALKQLKRQGYIAAAVVDDSGRLVITVDVSQADWAVSVIDGAAQSIASWRGVE